MSMTTDQRRKSRVLERRQEVAELHKKGWSQASIAKHLGVTQPTVSGDLKAIRQEWLRSSVRDFDLARATELQKLELVEREAHAGWERSQKPSQSAVIQGAGTQQPTRKTVRNQSGDPRFLDVLLKCIERRSEILGLNVPQKIAPTDTEGQLLNLADILAMSVNIPLMPPANVIDVENELSRDAQSPPARPTSALQVRSATACEPKKN